MSKDPVDIDINRYQCDLEAAERDWEANSGSRNELIDKAKESLFYSEALMKCDILCESEIFGADTDEMADHSVDVAEAIVKLYRTLPHFNLRKPKCQMTDTEAAAWDLVAALQKHEKLDDYLEKVLYARGHRR